MKGCSDVGKRITYGAATQIWVAPSILPSRVASCACTSMLTSRMGRADAVYGFLVHRCLEQAVASPAIFCVHIHV